VSALLKGGDSCPGTDAIQVMAMKIPKGQEFLLMAIPSGSGVLYGGHQGHSEVVDGGGWRRWVWVVCAFKSDHKRMAT
jgi:hypothetical protein